MKFNFMATQIIEADSLEEAKEKFAASSWNFAANAKCYPIREESQDDQIAASQELPEES